MGHSRAAVAEDISYRVRRSDRARRVSVNVGAGGVEVVLPRRAALREGDAAVGQLRPWIDRRLRALERARIEVGAPPGHVPYLGEHLRLAPEGGRTRAHRREGVLLVPAGDHRPAVERWYRRTARAEIAPRVEAAVAVAGLDYERLTIRGQKTRWASCSTTGTLSFNWQLLLAPEPVLDYVVWHEVCHLRVMDHGPGFWGLLAGHCPDYSIHERWLRRYGSTLTL